MKIVSLLNAPKVPFNLEGYIMHSSSSLEVIHLCLQPGQDISQHSNNFDVIVCLAKGEVTLHLSENKLSLELYDTVEVEKGVSRGFTNYGPEEARLIIMKKL
jgi:quercetin dioxygenase-like cupin family protein